MQVKDFVDVIGGEFYSGVPDSLLKPLGDYLMNTYGVDGKHHIIGANEGNCTAIAAGYHLATGKVPVVYMQNSGQGNVINPVASLLNDKVYAIPCIFVVGWRGEPGVHDEPQHIYQGEVTVKLLDDMDIKSFIVDKDTTVSEMTECMNEFKKELEKGKSVAFVVRKGALSYDEKVSYKNSYEMTREEIINHIVKVSGACPIVSTTGKASRELFEIREAADKDHSKDFLTVGSMGHSSSIALGIALNKPDTRIWCVDGDGAVLMHMGAMAVVGSRKPNNMIHIVINNEAHETVGGLPTVAGNIDLVAIAKACGYEYASSVSDAATLDQELEKIAGLNKLCMLEVKCSIGARADLGRPTTTAIENKVNFMNYLKGLN